MMPLTPATAHEFARLRQPVLPDRRVENQQHLVRCIGDFLRRDAADLVQLRHQVDAGVQSSGGVDEDDVPAAGLGGSERIEHDRRGVGSGAGSHHVDAGTLGPDLELLDRGGPEGIGGADHRHLAGILDQPRELADGGRLPCPVHADDHHDVRLVVLRDGRSAARRMPWISSLTSDRSDWPLRRLDFDRLDDLVRRRDADVGGDQRLLQRVDGFEIDRTGPSFRIVRALDHLVEAFDELLLGARE